jgi:hypothetical protein
MNVPQARLWHKGVQKDYKPDPHVTYYSTRNRLLMLSKHQAPLLCTFVHFASNCANTHKLENQTKMARDGQASRCNEPGGV